MALLPLLLTVLFVGLKLAGIIDWHWFLVVLPAILSVVLQITIEMSKGTKIGRKFFRWINS